MTDDKQIEAAFEEWWPESQQDQIWLKPSDCFKSGYKAAIEASHAKYVPELVAALGEIREIYAGMDGFIAETAPEGYLQRVVKQMYDEAIKALAKLPEGLRYAQKKKKTRNDSRNGAHEAGKDAAMPSMRSASTK